MQNNSPKIYKHKHYGKIIAKISIYVIAAIIIIYLLFFFAFKKYIAYSDTGKLYLDIPWLSSYMDGEPENDDLSEIITTKK